MTRFHCDRCGFLVMIESDRCLGCGSRLAFLPEYLEMKTCSESAPDADDPAAEMERRYRPCRNYIEHNICNWLVESGEPSGLCLSCRLTKVIPDLSMPDNLLRWYRLEAAKRRLVVGLMSLGLLECSADVEAGPPLSFHFVADPLMPGAISPAMTGHQGGRITINIAEADDAERERRRVNLQEPYRTLPGHLRHEVGHYYWDRLIGNSCRLSAFRARFGDERADYGTAISAHYQPLSDWQSRFVSAYASAHPWEDWAET